MRETPYPESHGRLLLILVVLLLTLFLPPANGATVPAGDTAGMNDPAAGALSNDAPPAGSGPDPHGRLDCAECHGEQTAGQSPSATTLPADDVQLCQGCHPVAHLHPLGVAPQPWSVQEKDFPLPLGKGIQEGRIVCLTCHMIHRNDQNPYLLREFDPRDGRGRNALCFHCHLDQFPGKSPHSGDTADCKFCHVSLPQQNPPPAAPPDAHMQAACLLCHSNLPDAHFAGVNPFLDETVKQETLKGQIFFADGRVVCTSCHSPHAGRDDKFLLRPDYLALAKDSRAMNPHRRNYLCLSCHLAKPVKEQAPLRDGGDTVKLCNRCHHSEYARPDIHPVEIKPSHNVRIPEDLPLQDEQLTCATCHDSLLQMSCQNDAARGNPYFLRRKTESRNAFCFLCHIAESYKRLNPHKQLNEQGEIVEKTCLFCHAAIPDVNYIGPERVSFIVQDPNEYCIGCHPGFTGNHPAGVNHLVAPSPKIKAAVRTSVQRIGVELPLYKGKIICATCHNPHQEGVIKIDAAATGTERANKLRLKPGRNLSTECIGCHWDK